jgi:hypothetical protein
MRLAGENEKSARTGPGLRGRAKLSAAVAMAATGLAALAAAAPAQAAASAPAASHDLWQTAYSTHGGASRQFDAITAPAKNDAWAVADTNTPNKTVTPAFFHWNGKAWSSVTVKAAAGLNFGYAEFQGIHPAYSTSPSNVWFFGLNQKTDAVEALVYNGKGWHIQPLPGFAYPLAVLGPKDVWGESLTSYASATATSTVLTHWNGRTWSDVTIQGIAPVASSAGGRAWIMTIDGAPTHVSGEAPAGPPIVYRITGAALNQVGVPGQATITQDQSGIAAAPDGRLWILSCNPSCFTGVVYTGSGNKWASSAVPANEMVTVVSTFSYDGRNGFWDGPYGHWTGSKMIDTDNQTTRQLADAFWTADVAVPIPGTASAWSGGYVQRTATGTATNAVIAVYGPLP